MGGRWGARREHLAHVPLVVELDLFLGVRRKVDHVRHEVAIARGDSARAEDKGVLFIAVFGADAREARLLVRNGCCFLGAHCRVLHLALLARLLLVRHGR